MQLITISKKDISLRLDKFLKQEFSSYTRGEIIRAIKNGQVQVNGTLVKPSYSLKENDILNIDFHQIEQRLIPNTKIPLEIVFQDEEIIVINKSAGISVHPVSFADTHTLANGLITKFPEIENIVDDSPNAKLRPGIVHRLDKDTSGLLLVAKNQNSFTELKKLFQERKIQKKYLAIVPGKLLPRKGFIEKPLAKATSYKKQVIAGKKTRTKIRPALTEYAVLKEFSDFSLVAVKPKTGRTHQIRIHLFSIGHPIVGDKLYQTKGLAKSAFVKRHLLHAENLEFTLLGKKYSFTAELPADFSDFLKNCA
jgi:23S rRNA pseudouridine1911/1915/1917 synthase